MYIILSIAFASILTINEIIGPNVLLGQMVMCRRKNLSKVVVDGVYDITKHEYCRFVCIMMILQLNNSYLIHYVAIYEGVRPTDFNNSRNWDYYTAYLLSRVKDYNNCGFFNRRALPPAFKKGHRINCAGWTNIFFPGVEIRLHRSGYGHSITEIEVMSLGMGRPMRNVMAYRGCYNNFHTQISEFGHNLQTCGTFCARYPFAALQEKTCLCGYSEFSVDAIATNRCYFKCPYDPGKYCGGRVGYSIYVVHLTFPYLHGCHKEYIWCNNHEARCRDDKRMTISMCLRFCNRTMYAGLVRGTMCLCTNRSPAYGGSRIEMCRVPCPGKPRTNCGGKTAMSLYGTCITESSMVSCFHFFRCQSLDMDEFGQCPYCKDQTDIPPHCYEKDLKKVVYDYVVTPSTLPSTPLPITIRTTETTLKILTTATATTTTITTTSTIVTSTAATIHTSTPAITNATTTAAATTSTTTTTTPTTTTTIATTRRMITDPCWNKPCMIVSDSVCVIVGDGYTCDCDHGFEKSKDGKMCNDVDECTEGPCDIDKSDCLNSPGSFVCDCKPGYLMDYNDVCTNNITMAIMFDPQNYPMMIFYAFCALVMATLCMVFYHDTMYEENLEESEEEE